MSRKLIFITALIALTMTSCNSINSEMRNLKNWNAGACVSSEVIEQFGEENTFVCLEITDDIFKRIYGKSYKVNCTIPVEELRYLKVLHYTLDGEIHLGEIICNKEVSSDLIDIFKELYNVRYPIEKMILVDEYDADDEASMSDNNSSSFNYRMVTTGERLSKHATGHAIDINPLYNPYVKEIDGQLLIAPKNAVQYIDRDQVFPYKIDTTDICYKLFTQHGFEWGGSWDNRKDYQHFEK